MINITRGSDFTLRIPVYIERIVSGKPVLEPFDLTDA